MVPYSDIKATNSVGSAKATFSLRTMRALYSLRRCARAALGAASRYAAGAPVPARQIHKGAPVIVHKRGADLLHDPWFNKVRDTRDPLKCNEKQCS